MKKKLINTINEAMKHLLLHWYEMEDGTLKDVFLQTAIKPLMDYKKDLLKQINE